MKLFLTLASIAAVMAAGSLTAQADTEFNANLASPGVYFGSGNPNGQFTVTNTVNTNNPSDPTATIEIGLRAKIPHGANITPTGDLYYAAQGPTVTWDYDFSINLGSTNLTVADVDTNSLITIVDTNTGHTAQYDPLLVPDDQGFHGVTFDTPFVSTDVGVQNSENLGFHFDQPLGFDPNAADTYTITLDVIDNGGHTLASDEIEVSTAPLPSVASMGALMFGAVGLGMFFRSRNARNLA